MRALGRHILVEFYGCCPSILNDVDRIEKSMAEAAQASGATIINTTFHHFSPYGVSGVVVIQESHMSIHTWPEYRFAAVDLFTCGDQIDPQASYRALSKSLQAEKGSTLNMHRGQLAQLKKTGSVFPASRSTGTETEVPDGYSKNIWFTDRDADIALSLRHAGILLSQASKFQKVEILNTYGYGKMLVLDGTVMCTERDEQVYHEMITHVALLTAPNPERVLVIGGGDGGAAREVLRHPAVSQVVVVEIDEAVVEACKAHLPTMGASFGDPRVRLQIGDGMDYIEACGDKAFDLIIVDATDPVGPAKGLFTDRFYSEVYRCLRPDGMMVAQTEPPALYSETFKEIYRRQRSIFGAGKVHCYIASIPTYTTGMLSFSYASKGTAHPVVDFDRDASRAFARQHPLKYYNEEVHLAAFSLPTFIKELLE